MSARRVALRSKSPSFQPALANSLASARPKPLAPPVMNTRLRGKRLSSTSRPAIERSHAIACFAPSLFQMPEDQRTNVLLWILFPREARRIPPKHGPASGAQDFLQVVEVRLDRFHVR